MANETRNVEILKEIYKNWAATKGGSVDDWLKICGDNIDFGSLAQGAAPKVQYMTDYSSRDALRDYFAGLTRDWEMIEYVADEFVAQGGHVVMLGRCPWRFKKTGKVVSTPKVDVWMMANSKAIAFFEYYDTAQVHAATA